ncbi:hypothetical protein EMIT0194P_310037 [Pseudomonas serbica]|jgi:DNA-binding transcriptional ArsR family regulator
MITPPEVFKSLADETRARATLLIAHQGELCVCELMCALDDSQPKISRHLAQQRAAAGSPSGPVGLLPPQSGPACLGARDPAGDVAG